MQPVTIYTTRFCSYCHAAKTLLAGKGAAFEEIDVGGNPELRRRMTELSGGGYTVPQIFIGGVHVGGCDELLALDERGALGAMLQAP